MFGVTLWEMFSHGQEPWLGLNGSQVKPRSPQVSSVCTAEVRNKKVFRCGCRSYTKWTWRPRGSANPPTVLRMFTTSCCSAGAPHLKTGPPSSPSETSCWRSGSQMFQMFCERETERGSREGPAESALYRGGFLLVITGGNLHHLSQSRKHTDVEA